MKRILAGHTVTRDTENMDTNAVESYSDATEYKPQPLSKYVVKPSSNKRTEIEGVFADMGVATKTNVETIVEAFLTKCTNTLLSHIVNTFESTFEGALQANYFNSNICLKTALFQVVEQVVREVV